MSAEGQNLESMFSQERLYAPDRLKSLRLQINAVEPYEIAHTYSENLKIFSHAREVSIFSQSTAAHFRFPSSSRFEFLGSSRLARRALRLDKCNIFPSAAGFIGIRQGHAYFYDPKRNILEQTLRLKNCRNILHQGLCESPKSKALFFGEYGNNGERRPVPIYKSVDGGKTWDIAYCFPEKSIKHVHGCYWDPFEEKIWTFTGDFSGENQVLISDENFKDCEILGDGSQTWRACNAFFTDQYVYWIMDSPLETSFVIRLERKSRIISKGQGFPGPVWYIKSLEDGIHLAATACERGPGVLDQKAHLFASADFNSWHEIDSFSHDRLPKGFFKFGVIGFADGPQTSQDFVLFGEALQGLDGKVLRCRLI